MACGITNLISNNFTAYRTVMNTKLNTAKISAMSQESKETFFILIGILLNLRQGMWQNSSN